MSEPGKELELRKPAAPNQRALLPALSIDELTRVAKAAALSQQFKVTKGARTLDEAISRAFVTLLVGQELGIAAGQSLSNIHIIDGKPTFASALMGALVKRHPGYDYRIVERSTEVCRIEWFELSPQLDEDGFQKRRLLGESEFTWDDAETAELTKKDNWKHYPKAMLVARAMTAGVRDWAPDVFNGPIYTPDEIEAGDDRIEIGAVVVESERLTETLDDGTVVDKATGEVVFEPGTLEHVPAEDVTVENPTGEVNKAPETPSADPPAEEVLDVAPEPAASEAPAEPAQDANPDVPRISDAQLKLVQKRRRDAGLEDDALWRVVLAGVAGVASARDVPKPLVTKLMSVLAKLEAAHVKGDEQAYRELIGALEAPADA